MKATELRVGDVIRVPGFNSTQRPGRLYVVNDESPHFYNIDNAPRTLTIRLSAVVAMFDKYCKPVAGYDGFFWAIERDGKQIWPEVEE